MSNIISFPGSAAGCRRQDTMGFETLIKAKLVTFCSFHHLKISLMELGRNRNFQIAADAIPLIDWATEQLHHVSTPDEDNFAKLKMLAKIVNQVGTYVELAGGYGPGRTEAEDSSSS